MFKKEINNPLSIGVIGAGNIVTSIHLPVLKNIECVHVAWIVDINNKRAGNVGKAFHVPMTPSLPSNLSDLPEADIVLLAAPYGVRMPYFDALTCRKGIGIYVEKPFARMLSQHDDLCGRFGEEHIADGFQRRSWSPANAARGLINSGLFGRLKEVKFGIGGPGNTVGNSYKSDFNLAGGGILFEVGVHGVDLILHILDAVNVEVTESEMVQEDGFDLHTRATLMIDAPVGNIPCSVVVSNLQNTTNQIDLVFDNATASFSMFSPFDGFSLTQAGRSLGTYSPLRMIGPLTGYQTFYTHWKAFIASHQNGKANYTSASCSRLTTKAIEKLYVSNAH